MRTIMLTTAALAAIILADSRPSQAYYHGRWCAVSSMGRGGAIERCHFNDFEACRMEIIAGNRGFCRPNGYYQGDATVGPKARKVRRARR